MQRSLLSFFPNPKKPRYDDNGQDNDSNDNDSSGDELVDNVQEKKVSEVHEVCEDSQDSEDTTHTRSTCDTVCDITTVNSSQLPENMCEGECCRPDRIEPYQPKQVDLSISIKHQGQQKRSFQTTWFNKYKWLTYCRSKNVSFCFICRKVRQLGVLAFNKRAEDAFVTIGFQNWKNATTRFRNHEKSDSHKKSYMKYTALKSPGVDTLISNDTLREQDIRRQMLLKQLSSLRFLARQGLPFHGHTETEGNFYQLMSLRANDDNHLQHWLCSQKYMSPEILNELIELMAQTILRSLLEDIKSVPFYSLIADETRDIGGKEQLAISLRWVTDSYDINEDLIGFFNVDKTDAFTLATILKDVLIRCNVSLSNCRGQTYDGASNMAGHLNGVAAKITREEPKALFVHCLAHSINLCLQDCAKLCKCVKDALGLVNEIYNLIMASPKRLALYEKLKQELSPQLPSLKPLCPTRWTVRTGAIDAVLKNYLVIQQTLEEISEESSGDISSKSSGLISLMDKFDMYFGLKLSHIVFAATEQLATTLQAKDVNAQICTGAVNATKSFLQRQRDDSAFTSFFDSVTEESTDITDIPKLPRKRKVPRRFDNNWTATSFQVTNRIF